MEINFLLLICVSTFSVSSAQFIQTKLIDIDIGGQASTSIPATTDVDVGGSTNPTAGTDPTSATISTNLPGVTTTQPPIGSTSGGKITVSKTDLIRIQSTNFGTGNYANNEATTWRFEANQCFLEAYCPCVDIPASYECLLDYLKIGDGYSTRQRFCGGNRPGGIIKSSTNNLSIRFRSNGSVTATGFVCYVRCNGPGTTPRAFPAVKCPNAK